ncbi:uncharacterized protein OCT59_005024 [Rhizophagus irregularis]|uniref:uncharacterized protein n=1 Tax=Rhizophagus irregularis TaxID=588596 RepID=UPI0033220586|nr:hypothetical protein OCT59_005024 [Rhizophagus irregularis]
MFLFTISNVFYFKTKIHYVINQFASLEVVSLQKQIKNDLQLSTSHVVISDDPRLVATSTFRKSEKTRKVPGNRKLYRNNFLVFTALMKVQFISYIYNISKHS